MKIVITAVTAAVLLAGTAFSANADDQGRTVSGAAIGAGTGLVVAGPPGAIVGGVIGAVIGGPKIVYYHGHRSYNEGQRHYYWVNHRRHYYTE